MARLMGSVLWMVSLTIVIDKEDVKISKMKKSLVLDAGSGFFLMFLEST